MKTGQATTISQRAKSAIAVFTGKSRAVPVSRKRGYTAARINRLTGDFIGGKTTSDAELRNSLPRLRERCRELERNNDYARRYFSALANNVIGSKGIQLQSKAGEWVKPRGSKTSVWQLDTEANRKIKDAWTSFSQTSFVGGGGDLVNTCRTILRSVARDGDVLIQHIEGGGGPFGYTFRVHEADLIDEEKNCVLPGGGSIRMGVEKDAGGATVAYWLRGSHPGDSGYWTSQGATLSKRYDARGFILPFIHERPSQSRGVPWMVSVMTRLHQLSEYEQAELIAARVAAAKMGFFYKEHAEGQSYVGEEDEDGAMQMDAEPGLMEELPYGLKFQGWDPQHPTAAFQAFIKATLRGIASGLNMSYNVLANDLEGVNFSSMRSGLLDEREEWMAIQEWFICEVIRPVFERWLPAAILAGKIDLPFAKLDKYNAPVWKPRRWQWVDPERDVNAALKAIDGGITSKQEVIANAGGDLEDVLDDQAQERNAAAERGLISINERERSVLDTVGVAARAGVITPSIDDERMFRNALRLPAMSAEVERQWKEEGGTRKPITLAQDEKPAAEASDEPKSRPDDGSDK